VGPYTAAAVAAIAFDVPTFALDGNAGRVVARLGAVPEPIDEPSVRERLRGLGQGLVPTERAGDFAQAVMELGATVCSPKSPSCTSCPVATLCEARARGVVEAIPARSPRRSKKPIAVVAVALRRAGRVLLVPRADGELLAGTFALPEVEIAPGADLAGEVAGVARALGNLGAAAGAATRAVRLGAFRHVFTHRDVRAVVYATAAPRGLRMSPGARWWSDAHAGPDAGADRDTLAIASYTRKALALLAPR
jgi:A/G-specific adenine glycosylase